MTSIILFNARPLHWAQNFAATSIFVRKRVRQELINIRASLLGQTVAPKQPTFCTVVPLAVDASFVPNDLNRLEFYGYDFDTTPIKVLLRNGLQTQDVSQFLDQPTHYHMTLNLGANGVTLGPNSNRFVLEWSNEEISTIAIIQPATPICQTRVVEFKPNTVSFVPPYVRGDREFDGNGPYIDADVDLVYTTEKVDAIVDHVSRGNAA